MIRTTWAVSVAAVLAAPPTSAGDVPPADRSGLYRSDIGEISLMEGPDALVFSYSAAAGEPGREHLCDWTGTALRRDATHFVWRDQDMTLTITLGPSRITMEAKDGRSMCGQGLGDDTFPVATRQAPVTCVISADRARFQTATESPSDLPAVVARRDRVEVLPWQGGDGFYVARSESASATVVGLLRTHDFACPAVPIRSPAARKNPSDPTCGQGSTDWCAAPPGDPCGGHGDLESCRADPRCGGMRYRGESAFECTYDARGFGTNCPTVGCISLPR